MIIMELCVDKSYSFCLKPWSHCHGSSGQLLDGLKTHGLPQIVVYSHSAMEAPTDKPVEQGLVEYGGGGGGCALDRYSLVWSVMSTLWITTVHCGFSTD